MIFNSLLAACAASLAMAAPAAIPASNVIPGSYIVTLKDAVNAPAVKAHFSWVSEVHSRSIRKRDTTGLGQEYTGLFKGYAGHFDEDTLSQIRAHPDVLRVEKDTMAHLSYVKNRPQSKAKVSTAPPGVTSVGGGLSNQPKAPYGLGTVSHRAPDIWEYLYDNRAGANTYAYVVDSGVRITHTEFEGRAHNVYTAFPGQNNDTLGHGTHVAGTLAGREFGVAKKATIFSVKVFVDDDAPMSTILAGYNWAVNDIIANGRQNSSVINMSLEDDFSQACNDAIAKAYNAGIVTVVAAGNKSKDASTVSPASSPQAITVGAVDRDWVFAWDYSNFGKALDILGPGSDVLSAWIDSDISSNVISGTSMASPHTAGLALYYMSVKGITGPKAIKDYLLSTATTGLVTGKLQGSPNLLGNNNNAVQAKQAKPKSS